MTIHEYLLKAVQDDARRAGERDRLLLEARRARRARRQRLLHGAPASRRTEIGEIVVSENGTLAEVIEDPAAHDGFGLGSWVGLIGHDPQLAKHALDEALTAGAVLLGRRRHKWLAARWPSRSGELAEKGAPASDGASRSTMLAGACPGQASATAPEEQPLATGRPQQ